MTHTKMTGAELQALREACGLDRDQFGALCGVQGRSIKYWETGASNHGVPADVAALVQELEAKVSSMAADAISRHSGAAEVVLMRTGDPIENEVASRVFLALRRRGQVARMVAFDVQAFKMWIASTGGRDTPSTRQEWARAAVAQQESPKGYAEHRADSNKAGMAALIGKVRAHRADQAV